MEFKQWQGFKCGDWQKEINVRDFIQHNYTPYEGDSSFLEGATDKTLKLWDKVLKLYEKEKNSPGGVLDIDTKTVAGVDAFEAGYIDKNLEEIVGFQTDSPLKRAIMPYGGVRIVEKAVAANQEANPDIQTFTGRIVSGDQFVSSAEVKEKLVQNFQAKCTEMEGAAIAHVCRLFGTPFGILRSISDSANEDSPADFPTFVKIAADNAASVIVNYLDGLN